MSLAKYFTYTSDLEIPALINMLNKNVTLPLVHSIIQDSKTAQYLALLHIHHHNMSVVPEMGRYHV